MTTTPQDFRGVFVALQFIWCPDTGEMLWNRDGRLERRYYRSDHWRHYRRQRLREADYRCEACCAEFQWGYDRPILHHKSYDRLGVERGGDSDTLVLCADCHALEHATLTPEIIDLFDDLLGARVSPQGGRPSSTQ